MDNTLAIACTDCGHINAYAAIPPGDTLKCQQCKNTLFKHKPHWEKRVSLLIVVSTVLFIASNLFPFISLKALFSTQHATLFSSIIAIYNTEQYLLALLIIVTLFVFPVIELFALGYVFTGRYFKRSFIRTRYCLYFLSHARVNGICWLS